MWPFGLMALRGGLRVFTRFRDDPRLAFLVAWYVPYWIVIEALPTKLPQYALPIYPAVILALAWALGEGLLMAPFASRWQRWLEWLTLGRPRPRHACAGGAGGGAAGLARRVALPGRRSWPRRQHSLTGALASGRLPVPPAASIRYAAFGGIATLALVMTFVLPSLTPVWLSPAIAKAFRAGRPCPGSVLASAGFEEPSLVFLAGTRTVLTDGAGAADYLASHPKCGIAAVSDRERPAFLAAAGKYGLRLRPGDAVEGINYSKGHRLAIRLYTVAKPQ